MAIRLRNHTVPTSSMVLYRIWSERSIQTDTALHSAGDKSWPPESDHAYTGDHARRRLMAFLNIGKRHIPGTTFPKVVRRDCDQFFNLLVSRQKHIHVRMLVNGTNTKQCHWGCNCSAIFEKSSASCVKHTTKITRLDSRYNDAHKTFGCTRLPFTSL